MAPRPLDRLRRICLALPEAHEQEAWGTPTFRVKGKLFAMYANPDTHTGAGRPGVWLHASKENQLLMVTDRPTRFFVPPYVGPSGWVGVWLDGDVDWAELGELARDAWRRIAPKKVIAAMDAPGAVVAATTRRPKAKPVTTKRATTKRATTKRATTKRATTKRAGKPKR